MYLSVVIYSFRVFYPFLFLYCICLQILHLIFLPYKSTCISFVNLANIHVYLLIFAAYFVSDAFVNHNYPSLFFATWPLLLQRTRLSPTSFQCSTSNCNFDTLDIFVIIFNYIPPTTLYLSTILFFL